MTKRRFAIKKIFTVIAGLTALRAVAESDTTSAEDALFRQIHERSKSDPLIGAKIGSKELTQRMIAAMKTEQGVHIESLLCALGALAGYACQASVRALAIKQRLPEEKLLTVVETKDGQTFFFGDNLNKLLAESKYSVWGIAAAGAQDAGCKSLPDINEIFKNTASVVGTNQFGKIRVDKKHVPQDTPINYLRALWPKLNSMITKFCPNPEHWPILVALSIQEVILMGKAALDPCISIALVMEAAIPMSKVNLRAVL